MSFSQWFVTVVICGRSLLVRTVPGLLQQEVLRYERHDGVGQAAAQRTQPLLLVHVEGGGVSGPVAPSLRLGHVLVVLLPAGRVHH